MKSISRRACVQQLGLAAAGAWVAPWRGLSAAEFGGAPAEESPLGEIPGAAARIAEFRQRFAVPGMSIAVARHGEMVFRQGFGLADPAAGTAVSPAHVFRIASVSKPLTSATVFALVEQGRLGLDDRVFGAGGRLAWTEAEDLPEPVRAITVRHLLTHTAGGWSNRQNDPMFRTSALGHRALILRTLRQDPLASAPGEKYAYSNFGYCVLGRVLEEVAGRPYAQVVERELLARAGIHRMRLAGNTRAERAPDEVVYARHGAGDPYGMNVARMDAHGGWLATAADLVRFAAAVDGHSAARNLLRPETIRAMTTPSAANPGYACGWQVNTIPNWWHGGSLPGTATLLVRTARGFCWAVLANTRTEGIGPALDRLMWTLVRSVPAWRA